MAKCPSCGEPVSQFAAGCAVCGADLEAARRERAERAARRPSLPGLPRMPDGAVTVALLVLVVLAFPLLGVILSGLAANREYGRLRTALIAVAVFGVLLIVSPQLRYGVFSLLG